VPPYSSWRMRLFLAVEPVAVGYRDSLREPPHRTTAMTPDRWRQITGIFNGAIALGDTGRAETSLHLHPARHPRFGRRAGRHDVIALDEALTALEQVDARKCQVVELRFFGGLNVEETAAALNVCPATVARDWTCARTWLKRELRPRRSGASRRPRRAH
jgi:DNA-directed RNA polymerase specialized sigma24 family protein